LAKSRTRLADKDVGNVLSRTSICTVISRAKAPTASRQLMNDQLVQQILGCPNLPTLPAIAVQMLDMAGREDIDIAEIACVVSKDAALSSKILRTVNSSFYARNHDVSTISSALVILGLHSVKTLVLGFSLVSNLSKNKPNGFKHITYWKRSIYAATAARSLAQKIGLVQQEEAFIAALLMDIGMLVLDQLLGDEYGEIHSKVESHRELHLAEDRALGMTHAEVAGVLVERWKLPPLLAVPVIHHHTPHLVTDSSLQKLAELVSLAARCADVFVDADAAQSIADVRKLLWDQFGVPDAEADALLADIGKRIKEVASLFEVNIGTAIEYETVLRKADEALIGLTLRAQMKDGLLAKPGKEAAKPDAISTKSESLPALSNRTTFEKFLSERVSDAVGQDKHVALLMIELDDFKTINDQHGRAAADMVLKTVAQVVSKNARPQDLAARYSNEEMALILPGTPRQAAAMVAESLRRSIAALRLSSDNGAILPVSVSVGVALYEPGSPFRSSGNLLKAAELALANAQRSGKNCVKVFSLNPLGGAKPAAA
jgi:two-component system cell cycle response regulator